MVIQKVKKYKILQAHPMYAKINGFDSGRIKRKFLKNIDTEKSNARGSKAKTHRLS
jgi:hypothetical protein